MKHHNAALILSTVGVVLALAALWLLTGRETRQPAGPTDGVVVVAAGHLNVSPSRQVATAEGSLNPPSQIQTALQVGNAARLRRPIAADQSNGIVCGEISPSGNPADFRRFVYNGAAGTGGIDDGSPLFHQYADKICAVTSPPKAVFN